MTGIRAARAEDVPALLDLEERVFPTDRLDGRAFRHAVRSASVAILVAEEPGGPGGYAIMEFRRGARVARLTSLAVSPDVAGRGLGRLLLAACEAEAAARGCDRVRLEMRADNARASALYDRTGYSRLAAVPDYYEDGETALRFEKELPPANG